ncbi:MAG: hypothetical protein NTZ05_12080 [Chloroflexi bacterium]|nr:hypothetical protein [Chloroflexota bacterium]
MVVTPSASGTPEPMDAAVALVERATLDPIVEGLRQARKDGQMLYEVADQLRGQHESIWLAADHGNIYRAKTGRELTAILVEKGLVPLETPQVYVSAEGWLRIII